MYSKKLSYILELAAIPPKTIIMKIFISWSGETSKNIAEILRQWFPGVIQAVKPYYSPDDITKGTRWSSEISKELDASKVGIICLTKDNLESPWIMFEAGAISKNIDKSKVCPILFNVEPTDIQGPLIQFQAAKFSKSEIKKVVKMINAELTDASLASDVLDSVFEMWWPKLNEKIEAELSKAVLPKASGEIRPERDILEEILTLTRNLSIVKSRKGAKDDSEGLNFRAFSYMVGRIEEMSLEIKAIGNRKLHHLLIGLVDPLMYVIDEIKSDVSNLEKEEALHKLRQIFKIDLEEEVSLETPKVKASSKRATTK